MYEPFNISLFVRQSFDMIHQFSSVVLNPWKITSKIPSKFLRNSHQNLHKIPSNELSITTSLIQLAGCLFSVDSPGSVVLVSWLCGCCVVLRSCCCCPAVVVAFVVVVVGFLWCFSCVVVVVSLWLLS